MNAELITGGCQCGAVRYRIGRLGRPIICHCRMCQKAFGGFFAPLVPADGVEWTRGTRSHFESSDSVRRGFCAKCGTQLTHEYENGLDMAIGTLDNPGQAAPMVQINTSHRLPYFNGLCRLPVEDEEEIAENDAWNAKLISFQHPDHETVAWPPETKP
ncbi:MAG: GFA family protein [Hoeflea sp.]|uniref:GFA family protein n=1 Tax=Hoeflea sp. TaxID=1940281 RepID=UPI003EF94BD7